MMTINILCAYLNIKEHFSWLNCRDCCRLCCVSFSRGSIMSVIAFFWTFVLLLFTTWHTSLVGGQNTSPPPMVLYVRESTTAEIPWTYNWKGPGELYEIKYSYKPATGPLIHIYSVGKNGKEALNKTDMNNRFKGRLKYTGDNVQQDGTLAIERFTKQDEGLFEFETIGDGDKIDLKRTLKVMILSNVTEFKASKNYIKEGDNITLSCTVTKGLPSPQIAILRGNKKINDFFGSNTTDTTLTHPFKSISPNSDGSYVCKVTTEDYSISKTYKMEVKYAPKFTKKTIKQYGCLDRMIELNCKANGNPKPEVLVILPDGNSTDKLNIKLKTFGVYRCEANNKLGNVSYNITISEEKDQLVKPVLEECTFDLITWKQYSNDVKVTLQFKEKNSIGTWNNIITTLDISYIPKNTESFSKQKDYEFRLHAENCVGIVTSDTCSVVKDNSQPSGERSSNNAGVIAGSVIAVLVVIVIIVIIVIVLKKRGILFKQGRNREENVRMTDSSKNTSTNPQTIRSQKTHGELLHGEHGNEENGPSGYVSKSEPPDYSEIGHPGNPNASTDSNNIPSWV